MQAQAWTTALVRGREAQWRTVRTNSGRYGTSDPSTRAEQSSSIQVWRHSSRSAQAPHTPLAFRRLDVSESTTPLDAPREELLQMSWWQPHGVTR